jgi:hypothetical protein
LLGGAGYLLTQGFSHAGGEGASGLGGGTSGGVSAAPPVQGRSGSVGLTSRSTRARSQQPSRGSPLLGEGVNPPSQGAGAPFSDGWQQEATPDLGGSPPDTEGPGGVGGAAPSATGPSTGSPSIAEGPSYDGDYQRKRYGDTPGGGDRASWRAEAREFGGKARALSNQLGQVGQESSGSRETKTSSESTGSETARAAKSSSSGPEPPDEPPQVPIDDHLHWLVVAGVLWGAWRIWRGA